MVFYAGAGGMRGTGLVQIIKAAILFTTTGVMCALLISRFHGSLPQLLDAAAGGSGLGSGYLHTGNQYGHTFTGMWSLMGLQLTVIVGAAGLPHVTMRLYAAPTPASARTAMHRSRCSRELRSFSSIGPHRSKTSVFASRQWYST